MTGARHARAWLLVGACGAWLQACSDDGQHGRTSVDAGAQAQLDAGFPQAVEDAGGYEFPCFNPGPVTHAPTFSAVYREIFCTKGCASAYCHGARGQSAGLNIETFDVAYANLLDEPAGTQPESDLEGCRKSGLRRVEPGRPEQSLLYLKVNGSMTCGLPMPPPTGAWEPLDVEQLAQLRAWIAEGAVDDRRASGDDAGR